ncbi:MAG: hypothetical protein JNG84_14260, partial [Archangium sp.]|nr:hypothetical protein [Archangium sp.]
MEPSPDELERLERQQRLLRASGMGSAPAPWFAHLRLETPRRTLDVLVGTVSRSVDGATLIDWRSAPLSEVFFGCDEGESYELELQGRVVSGRVVEKSLVVFGPDGLERLDTPVATLRRGVDGRWRRAPLENPAVIEARPPSVPRVFRSPLEVTLDVTQRRVVDLPPEVHALVLGEAGFGKTTVALHRLLALRAAWQRNAVARGRPPRVHRGGSDAPHAATVQDHTFERAQERGVAPLSECVGGSDESHIAEEKQGAWHRDDTEGRDERVAAGVAHLGESDESHIAEEKQGAWHRDDTEGRAGRLVRSDERRGEPESAHRAFRGVVVVPTEGLRRLTRLALDR